MWRSIVAGAEVVNASDALSVLLGFGVTVTALTVKGAEAVVATGAATVVGDDALSSDVHEARAREAATRHVSTAARPRIGGTLRQPAGAIRAGREGAFA